MQSLSLSARTTSSPYPLSRNLSLPLGLTSSKTPHLGLLVPRRSRWIQCSRTRKIHSRLFLSYPRPVPPSRNLDFFPSSNHRSSVAQHFREPSSRQVRFDKEDDRAVGGMHQFEATRTRTTRRYRRWSYPFEHPRRSSNHCQNPPNLTKSPLLSRSRLPTVSPPIPYRTRPFAKWANRTLGNQTATVS